jgi:hypothetical protein
LDTKVNFIRLRPNFQIQIKTKLPNTGLTWLISEVAIWTTGLNWKLFICYLNSFKLIKKKFLTTFRVSIFQVFQKIKRVLKKLLWIILEPKNNLAKLGFSANSCAVNVKWHLNITPLIVLRSKKVSQHFWIRACYWLLLNKSIWRVGSWTFTLECFLLFGR